MTACVACSNCGALILPMTGFKYTKGSAKQFSRLDRPVTREFCAECGTHIVARAGGFPAVILNVGALDDPKVFAPKIAIYTCDKQPFHRVPEGIPTFEKLPG